MLPKNPELLLSIVNMKLRDFYESLEELCEDLDESEEEITSILNQAGYVYQKNENQFKLK